MPETFVGFSMIGWSLAVVAVAVGTGCTSGFGPRISCQDLQPGTARYQANMDEIARAARLPGGLWNRYHESAVSELCHGQSEKIDTLTADGLLDISATERLAAVLNKLYTPRPRSSSDVAFGEVRQQLVRMGTCGACADNIARYYVRQPASPCAELAKRALAGQSDAVKELLADPDYCKWTY